ncbi:hypothetical protein T484DRAFT_1984028 [Baffinella frigidus]|nr:hypothetical protein T484DRAFT_1984028 [Cryptophyta sp. CCMP2293]|mmetsp:Transcript_59109/g.140608  ORF Transcript_59109/g.140608 Transcript_59109/m.140608 type:complete len:221 (-) Transcript_59109:155-817(-)|eukprot:CAMPEP_0180149472 /NCGR_PEP_ID=MMETSP0986-20121125/20818_1 /TAXON_ID=697907 /ORGANISM="non described non described, Strain CCMP2293" /LENGTH=220 /DNA_ID=CAMNT_0022096111 /DNA_START=53 /DNA_END=715 /DNA_ORIENTATION=-
MSYGALDDVEAGGSQQPQERRGARSHMRSVLAVSVLLCCAALAMAVQQRGLPTVLMVAESPWGVDFDIKYARGMHQWQITNLVLHPPPPAPPAAAAKPMVMTKATFPFFELQAMNKADAMVKEKMADPNTDPKLVEAMEAGAAGAAGALDSAVGCAEGSSPGASVSTACPGVGSGKPAEVKRQWSMGFPPQVGAAAQAGSAFKRRGLTGGDVDRGQTDDR